MLRLLRRVSLLSLLLVFPLALSLSNGVPPALAGPPPTCSGTYTTAGETACIVPAGTTAITITAIGGAGGAGYFGSAGGQGDAVTATFAVGGGGVTPGATLYIEVGSDGGDGHAFGTAGTGGSNGGGGSGSTNGVNGAAGGGGGASDVRTCSVTSCTPLTTVNDSRLLVAGGGGGGASDFGATGGPGGNAGQPGMPASNGASGGGGAGTASTGGTAGTGSPAGGAGGLGTGGTGGIGFFAGGGGGGGYYGGGGGGGDTSGCCGGGGGGGSDFVKADGTDISMAAGSLTPRVTMLLVPSGSTTVLTATQNPSVQGQPVTFTATVSCPFSPDGGTVAFSDISTNPPTPLGSATVSGGVAVTQTATLTPGAHSIVAVYNGNANCTGSTSNGLSRSVLSTAGGVQLQSSANPSALGGPVTFTASISCPGYVPTGTVTFKDGSTVLGSASVSPAGQASLRVTTLSAGSHTITAAYGGDSHCAAGTSAPLVQTVRSSGFGFGG